MEISAFEKVAWINLREAWLNTINSHDESNINKYPTAHHEAGHAVINLVFGGWENTTVTIKTSENGKGCCSTIVVEKLSHEEEAVSFLAGAIAELLTGSIYRRGVIDDWWPVMARIRWILESEGLWNDDLDVREIEQLMKPTLDRVLAATEKLVHQHKEAIVFIAKELIKHETLSGTQIKELFHRIEP